MALQSKRRKLKPLDNFTSFLFVLPAVLGILLFTLLPMVSSLYYSFTEYNTMVSASPQKWVGLANYKAIFTTEWPKVGHALGVTALYSLITIPLYMIIGFALALPLFREARGVRVFRTLVYLPVLIPMIISGYLWNDLTQSYGHINQLLVAVGLKPYAFFTSNDTAMTAFILMGLFTVGGNIVLWVAQMKAIPDSMFEAAKLEGARYPTLLLRIIIPMCTPMIFYNLVLSVVNSLQTYASAIVVRTHLNADALDFYVGQVYSKIVEMSDLGLGSAMSWLLFAIIAIIAGVTFKFNKWVYYEEEM